MRNNAPVLTSQTLLTFVDIDLRPQSWNWPDYAIAPNSNIATNTVYTSNEILFLTHNKINLSSSSTRRRVKMLQSLDQRYSCEYIALHNVFCTARLQDHITREVLLKVSALRLPHFITEIKIMTARVYAERSP